MAFIFEEPLDPKNPLDISDLPPEDWSTVDAQDYRKALFGFPSETFTECVEWEKHERETREVSGLSKSLIVKHRI